VKAIEPWKSWVFFGTLGTLALLINGLTQAPLAPSRTQTTTVRTIADVPQPARPNVFEESTSPPPKPVEAKLRIWPGDYTPTRRVHIPDPENPASGVLDVTFRPTDDMDLNVAQWWEVQFDKKMPEELEMSQNDMDNFKREGIRNVRLRLKKNSTDRLNVRFLITKKNPDDFKPLPEVPPQTFGNLSVTYRRLQGVSVNEIVVDLELKNNHSAKKIGVAIHGPPSQAFSQFFPDEIRVKGSLMDNKGVEYWCSQVTGLQVMNANPTRLTSIDPGETRHISLRYQADRGHSQDANTFRLLMEFVVNQDYSPAQYANHVPVPNAMPAGCRVEGAVFSIPIRYTKRE